MLPGERFKNWIDGLAEVWKDRLRGWMASWVLRGFEELMESMEPEAIDILRVNLSKIVDHPATPQELKDVISSLSAGTKPLPLLILIPLAVLMLIPAITAIFQPLGNLLRYAQERVFRSFRLDPLSVITAWRRDPETYEKYLDDLREQGWTDERIEALKFVTLIWPSRQDLIKYVAKEALEPEAISKYGLMDEFDRLDLTLFDKIGISRETARLDWIAHWEHASWMQIVEMLHRGLLTEADVWDWFRLVEIPPFWRQPLIDTAYTWPTRVDVRRWWDMRTIDETELRRLYSGMGYRGVNLDNYVLWTKVYVAFPDLMARWTKGWITLDDVRSQLTGLGMPADRVEEMIQMKIKPEKPERTITERDITKSDIYKGIKADQITRDQGIELLMDLGFDEDEADLLMATNVPEDETAKVVKQRELSKTDIKAGIAKEIISREEARTKLLELRYKPVDVDFLLDIYEVVARPPPDPRVREASKADIVLGVKKGLITQEEGYGMLLDLNFTPEASSFILTVRTEESPFSPINYGEFKDLTTKYKIATGREVKPMPEELKKAAAEVVKLTDEVESLQRAIEEEEAKLIPDEVLPEAATERLTELQVSLHRAQAELSRVQTDYKIKLAEWRHGV